MSTFYVPIWGGCYLVIDLDATGAQAVLSRRIASGKDISPLLNAIARVMRESFGRNFAVGGDPPWRPLAPSTIRRKIAMGVPRLTKTGRIPKRLVQNGQFGPANILIATGALRDSYRQKGAKGHVEKIDEQHGTVEVGSRLKTPDGRYSLAAIHQFGTEASVRRRRMALSAGLARAGKANAAKKVAAKAGRGGGIPARPVRLTSDDVMQMKRLVRSHFAGA